MKTTRSLDLKCLNMARAINIVAKQATSGMACAGFQDTEEYVSKDKKTLSNPQGQKKGALKAAQIAAVLEYGSPLRNIPSRPFMSNAIKRNHGAKLTRIAKKHLEHLFREEILNMGTYDDFGNYNPMTAARRSKRAVKAMLDEWATAMHDAIKHEVNNGTFAPLNPIYAKRRKKSKFLENSDDFVKQIDKWTTTER